MYTLLVCADLYGEKTNLEISFPAMPTIGELQRKVIEVFSSESQLKRPQGYPAIEFTIARLQVYDDVLLKWADLVTATQLHEYDQLYAFQPQSPWHIDVQKDLPPPRPPTVAAGRAPPAAPPSPAVYETPYSSTRAPAAEQQPPYGGCSSQTPHGKSPYTPQNVSSIPPAATASGARQSGGGGNNRSPVLDRLEQNRSREEQLRLELQRIAEENRRLEQEAEAEREEERRRAAIRAEETLREREAEIQRQRDALRKMEEEYAREQARLRNGGR